MRKLFAVLVVTGALLGVVSTAFAENGSIWPVNGTKSTSKIRLSENKSIWPF